MRRALPLVLALPLGLLLAGCADLLGTGEEGGALELTAVDPPPGSVGAPALGPLSLSFSRKVDPATLPQGIILAVAGRPLEVSYAVHGGRTVVLTPTDPLDFGTEHELRLTSALRSRAGGRLGEPASLAFVTEGIPLPPPSRDSLLLHLEALAHGSMHGRASGSVHELQAAGYLSERFAAYGLQPPAGGMIQGFTAWSSRSGTLLDSRNVLAVLPGSGTLAEEWVVVGAHYDHIGYRNLPDQSQGPNNGRDDNASGTALVLEMARLLRSWTEEGGAASNPRRSLLFAAWGAEEEGLLGSCHYVVHAPTAPLSRTRALMNFDMVGRLRDDVLVVSGGETSVARVPLVRNANAPGLALMRPVASSPRGTDHACFWQAAILWVGFFTGFHQEYHTPGDDVELINFPGMVRIGELALRVLVRLAVVPRAPAFAGPIPSF